MKRTANTRIVSFARYMNEYAGFVLNHFHFNLAIKLIIHYSTWKVYTLLIKTEKNLDLSSSYML